MIVVTDKMKHAMTEQIEQLVLFAMSRFVGLLDKCGPGHHNIAQICYGSRRGNERRRICLCCLSIFLWLPELVFWSLYQRLFEQRKRKNVGRFILLPILFIHF